MITTRHTRHILDLDRRTYRREPGPDGTPMLHDDRTLALTRIQMYPRVGDIQLVWFDDPDVPQLVEHWRQSSTITDLSPQPDTSDITQEG